MNEMKKKISSEKRIFFRKTKELMARHVARKCYLNRPELGSLHLQARGQSFDEDVQILDRKE